MVKASDVKELREKTGAGMLDCKKALDATDGNIEKAIDWLREKGISKAAKKADRIAAEGICQIKTEGNTTVILEVNSETDFVAKNEEFTNFVNYLSDIILNNDVTTVEEVLNLTSLRRFQKVTKNDSEVFGTYKHMGGTIGAVVVLEGANEEVAKDVAMHVAAMNPVSINESGVPAEMVEHEKTVIKEQIKNDESNKSKPEAIIEKMATGRLNKFLKEICLEQQAFIKDTAMTVADYVKENSGKINNMVRFAVGEGIEKKEENFAEEVAKQING